MTKDDLLENEYNPYYQTYVDKAGNLPLGQLLRKNGSVVAGFLEAIPSEKHEYNYQEGKWTVKEIVQHMIDVERVFTYRGLCIARRDKSLLPGFDQDDYAVASGANARSMSDLIKEYKAVRMATIVLFESFTKEMLLEVGTASGSQLSARATAFIVVGHENHHCSVIRERYL